MPKIVDREAMRNGILDAAMSVFADKGYHAATIADVAKAADLGKGTLYLYFKNKEAIAEQLVERYFADMEAALRAAHLPDDLDVFLRSIDENLNISDAHVKAIRVFFEVFGPSFASDSFTARISEFFAEMGAHYARALSHLQERGAIRTDIDPAILGRALASAVDGLALHRGLFDIPTPRYAAMRRETLAMFRHGLVER